MENKTSLRFPLALTLAKGINKLVNIIDPTRGTNLSGEKALLIDPYMVSHFKNIDPSKVILITGTNGKSSSTNLITHILRENGFKVISNLEGANLLSGIATSLAKESDLKGNTDADFYVFETDERYLPLIYEQLPAKNLLVMNLQKDQVQRNGDPDFIYQKVKSVINPEIKLFLNNEEPRSKSFETDNTNVIYFGVEPHKETFNKDESFPTEACPICHHKLDFNYYNVDGVGQFECTNCNFKSQPVPDYSISDIDYENKELIVNGVKGSFPYDYPFMFYNYAAAAAVCKEVAGLSEKEILNSFHNFENIGGRFETFEFGGKTIKYMRIKQENPDTLQSALNTIAQDKEQKAVFLGLYPIHDFTPGYTNSFYTYDCDFKPLIESNVDYFYCFSPAVCYDTALRISYEDFDMEKVEIEETEDPEKIFNKIIETDNTNIYLITWLHTFEDLKKYVKSKQEESNG